VNMKNLCGDFQNGNLYELSFDEYTDNGMPIVRRRGFPHIIKNGKLNVFNKFSADFECGAGISGSTTQPTPFTVGAATYDADKLYLRWSDTRGGSWGQP